MHDPMTVAHEIRYPWRKYRPWPKNVNGWNDLTDQQQRSRSSMWREGYRETFITIWHVDPETDGSDDSCGWFKRARHGNKDVLQKIVNHFEAEWDNTHTGSNGYVYPRGLFWPNGSPNLSPTAIVLELFFIAINAHLSVDGSTNWKESREWMQKNLFEILHFAENPHDSLRDCIMRTFEIGCNEPYTKHSREARIREAAGIIYGWILRKEQPWYKHPRWHFWHWEFQCHPIGKLKRRLFSKCATCGRHFRWNESPVTNSWHTTGPLWFRSEKDAHHMDCVGQVNSEPCSDEKQNK